MSSTIPNNVFYYLPLVNSKRYSKIVKELLNTRFLKRLRRYDAQKKGQLTKQVKGVQKNQFLRRVVEGLFLSKAGPKSGC